MPTPKTRKPTGKKSYHHGDLRAAMVREARRLVQEEGSERLSLRAIGREVGVSHAALYHHFPDRESLLASVAAGGFAGLRQAMLERAQSSDGPPLARLQEAGVAYVLFAWNNPHLYRLMFSGRLADRARFPQLQTAADGAYAALGRLLGQMGDEPGTDDDLADHPAGRAAWAMVHGLAMLLIDGRFGDEVSSRDEAERVAREVTLVLGRGLKAMA